MEPISLSINNRLVHCGTGGGANRHRGRFVFVGLDGRVHLFEGKSIPGVVRVLNDEYEKNGKWSYTTWDLLVAPGVQVWTNAGGSIRDLIAEKKWTPESGPRPNYKYYFSLSTWKEVDEAGLSREMIRVLLPDTSKRLDENDLPI